MGIVNFFEVGQMGVEHALLPEKGLVVPGDVVIGADSAYMYLWSFGSFLNGNRKYRHGCRNGNRRAWFKVPEAMNSY